MPVALVLSLLACTGEVTETIDPSHAYVAEAWADNWFAMYTGGALVVEDSVPISTERSFNAERFTFDADDGATLAFVLKDFKETDSGLEYIGADNQQMGDGGFIFQVSDQGSGELVLVSDADWVCLTTHEAPLNKDCESSADPDADCEFAVTDEPDGWMDDDFDDSGWDAATVHSAADMGPKDARPGPGGGRHGDLRDRGHGLRRPAGRGA